MADRKITELTALAAGSQATGDLLAIVDVSETASANKNKKITVESLFKGIPGNVGIGTASPGQLLHLSSASPRILLTQTSANSNAFLDAATSGVLEFSADDNNVAASSSMRFKVDGSELMRIDSSGVITTDSGHTTARLNVVNGSTVNTYDKMLLLRSNNLSNAALGLGSDSFHISSLTNAPIVFHTNSDGGTSGSAVPSNERMRIDSSGRLLVGLSSNVDGSSTQINFSATLNRGSNATAANANIGVLKFADLRSNSAYGEIRCQSDGTPGTNDYPGRLTFSTTADGASSPSERMRIDKNGNVQVNVGQFTVGTTASTGLQFINDGTFGTLQSAPLVFRTVSAERMRIDTSGNVGIGETSADTRLHIKESTTGATGIFIQNSNGATNSSADLYFGNWSGSSTTTPQARLSAINKNVNSAKTDLAISIYDGNNTLERARIDGDGRLLVGKTSHSGDALFVVESNHTSGGIIGEFDNNDAGNFGGVRILGGVNDRECRLQSLYGNSFFTFYTEGSGAAAERMRITETGVVTINRSTGVFDNLSLAKLHVYNNEADKYVAAFHHDGNNANRKGIYIACGQDAGTGTLIQFEDGNGSTQGNITFSSGSVSYNTSSDYRLKENVVDLDGAITRVKQLAPKRFNFIDQERTVDGFVAHEAATVVPEAVTGTHNEVDDDGNAVMQGIDQSKLVPLLTAALQEAIAEIETLKTKVAALEAG